MKEITLKNSKGTEYTAKVMSISELMKAWDLYEISTPFYTWIERLMSENIITQLDDGSGKFIVINL